MSVLNLPDNFTAVIPIVAGIGNALMTEPMVRQLCRARPRARVLVAARIAAMAEPFRRLPGVVDVDVFGNGIAGLRRFRRWTRTHRADVCLVPFPSNRWQYNVLAAASGATTVLMHDYPVGRATTLRFLSRATRLPAQRGLHDVEQNLRLLSVLDIEPAEPQAPRFALNDADRASAARLLAQVGIAEGQQFIIIHAGSAQTILAQAKRWPPSQYAQLIRCLRAEFAHKVVLIEGPDEAGVATDILRHLGHPDALPIQLNGPLGDAAALLERAALYVGSDSGLAHLADAVGTRAVTLFAPADPTRVAPFGSRDLVVQTPADCAPCLMYPWEATKPKIRCREPLCINRISVEMVMRAVRKGLA